LKLIFPIIAVTALIIAVTILVVNPLNRAFAVNEVPLVGAGLGGTIAVLAILAQILILIRVHTFHNEGWLCLVALGATMVCFILGMSLGAMRVKYADISSVTVGFSVLSTMAVLQYFRKEGTWAQASAVALSGFNAFGLFAMLLAIIG
jgi:hypothetical protein